jgi:hypothetical protein
MTITKVTLNGILDDDLKGREAVSQQSPQLLSLRLRLPISLYLPS